MILYTVAEVQGMLKIGKSRAYQLVQSGEIPHVRIGKLLRVRATDLDAYLESCEA
jgi:excisionase family DNA binding protein